jgi:hypothetical protein
MISLLTIFACGLCLAILLLNAPTAGTGNHRAIHQVYRSGSSAFMFRIVLIFKPVTQLPVALAVMPGNK